MAVRSGQEFIDGLRRAPREVWTAGRRVADVTTDPVFARPVRSIAELYDLQVSPEHREAMTHARGRRRAYGASFLIPRIARGSRQAPAVHEGLGRGDLRHGRPLARLSQHHADDLGRGRRTSSASAARSSPTTSATITSSAATSDLFLTHAIVNPQTDRSKGSHQQDDEYAHLGVVEETKDGLIVRGAKMLATHGPTADEILVYPQPGNREGEENYVLAFGIPCATKGLKFICREPFDDGTQSPWDHPLGARFEEPDAVCVFDDVLIPGTASFSTAT